MTAALPKPLLPVCGQSVAERSLATLATVGCSEVALNLHHRGEEIRQRLGDSFAGLTLTYSEEAEILGTLGALYPLRDFFAQCEAILLVNGDALCQWPWKTLLKRHFSSGADATLLLARRVPVERFGGGVGRAASGRLAQLRDAPAVDEVVTRHVFTGAHVLSPRLLDRIGPGFGDIVGDLYMPLLAEGGHIETVLSSRRWHDLGTPARYLEACLSWRRVGRLTEGWRRRGLSASAQLAAGARTRRSVLEGDCQIGADSRVDGSLVLPGARLAAGTRLETSIVGPGVELPSGASIDHRMVCQQRAHEPIAETSTLLGDLVYTPL